MDPCGCWPKKKSHGNRETVPVSAVEVRVHRDSWLGAQMCPVLKPNTKAQRLSFLSHLLRSPWHLFALNFWSLSRRSEWVGYGVFNWGFGFWAVGTFNYSFVPGWCPEPKVKISDRNQILRIGKLVSTFGFLVRTSSLPHIDPKNSNFKNRKICCRIIRFKSMFGEFWRIFPKNQTRHRQKTGDDLGHVSLSYDILCKWFPFRYSAEAKTNTGELYRINV